MLYFAKRQVLKKLDSADERPCGHPREAGHERQEHFPQVQSGIFKIIYFGGHVVFCQKAGS
jgi:hypothetical protein